PSDAATLCRKGYSGHTLGLNGANLNLSVGLTMTLTLAVALLGGILEDANLLTLAVLHDSCAHAGTLHNGSTKGSLLTVQNRQNVKLDLLTSLSLQLFNEQSIALCHLILLATSYNNC